MPASKQLNKRDEPKAALTIWTIGHSTRTLEELVATLQAHGIEVLVDVRAFPASRRNPQFSRESLERELPKAGVEYLWMGKDLGGRRRMVKNSPDVALRNESFRAYAHHMRSAAFREGIDELLRLAQEKRVAIMCAEMLWWRCHRSMISDYLETARGVEVKHIRDASHADGHWVKAEARVEGDLIFYDLGETRKLV
jgi:uncharacterized protein (DUF488 family)